LYATSSLKHIHSSFKSCFLHLYVIYVSHSLLYYMEETSFFYTSYSSRYLSYQSKQCWPNSLIRLHPSIHSFLPEPHFILQYETTDFFLFSISVCHWITHGFYYLNIPFKSLPPLTKCTLNQFCRIHLLGLLPNLQFQYPICYLVTALQQHCFTIKILY
jgi:hypothetical protein